MALFQFGKKKEEKAPCCCNCGCTDQAPAEHQNTCCGETVDGICCIKVLGAGCKACRKQYENAKAAVIALGLPIEVAYITDMEKIMQYGVMSMPAIVINEKVAAMGKVLNAAEVETLLRSFGA